MSKVILTVVLCFSPGSWQQLLQEVFISSKIEGCCFFFKFLKLVFYIQRASIVKVDVLDDLFKEIQLAQLNEANVLRILAETLAAHIDAIFPDQMVPVWAEPARVRTLAEFSQMAPVELLVTYVAFSVARRQEGGVFSFIVPRPFVFVFCLHFLLIFLLVGKTFFSIPMGS